MSVKTTRVKISRHSSIQSYGTRCRFALAARTEINGMVLGIACRGKRRDSIRAKVMTALDLVEQYAPSRYRRMERDIVTLFVLPTPGYLGMFVCPLSMIMISEEFAASPLTTPAVLASILIHESTHAWLAHLGLHYDEHRCHRIEQICYRAEQAFTRRLPDSESESKSTILSTVESNMCRNPQCWTDLGHLHVRLLAMSQCGYPDWLIDLYASRFHRWVANLADAVRK